MRHDATHVNKLSYDLALIEYRIKWIEFKIELFNRQLGMFMYNEPIQGQSKIERKPSPIETEVNRAQNMLEELIASINILEERLRLVIQATPAAISCSNAPKEAASCDLHDKLQNCTNLISTAAARISSMTSRVQL